MKQVININFQGRVVPIEVTAFEILKRYTESLSRHFAAEDGRDEIINDIENRIGELFQERLKEGATCITEDHVNGVIRSMGRPEDFDDTQATEATAQERLSEHQSGFSVNVKAKRLFRDENDKVIGGVCSGLANYFGIDVVIIRIIFVVLAVSFGIGFIPYLILWIAVPSTASTEIGAMRKKLYRDGEEKIIGGVCSGLGHYFGINPWIPRVLFLLPFLSFAGGWGDWDGIPDFFRFGFSPGAFFVYIILWLVIPEAFTTTEKLEMKGEKVDLNSIKNSVVEEMKGVHERAAKLGREAKEFAESRGKVFTAEAATVAKRSRRSFGDIIGLLIKMFVYFILGCIGFGLVVALFAFSIFAIGLFPLKEFLLADGWQNVFAWGTLIFFVVVPIIGIITWIIRRLARIKTNRRAMRFSFAGLWLVGLISFIGLIVSVGKDFRSTNNFREQEIALDSTSFNKLVVTSKDPSRNISRISWFSLEPFESMDDTAHVRNITVNIIKSTSDSFRVTMMKMAQGRDRRSADTLASLINFNVNQIDSVLMVDRGIPITRENKFRNQRVVLNIYVPVGRQIRVDKSVGWSRNINLEGPWHVDLDDIQYEGIEYGWEHDVDYVMKEDGLYTLTGEPADEWKERNRKKRGTKVTIDGRGIQVEDYEDGDGYRYDGQPQLSDSLSVEQQQEKNRVRDSLEKVKEEINRELNKISRHEKPSSFMINKPSYNPMMILY